MMEGEYERMEKTYVNLPVSVKEKLDRIAEFFGLKRSQLIRYIIMDWVYYAEREFEEMRKSLSEGGEKKEET